ncbi:hypothetical protein [Sorangium cellulosum]|uniref:Uncharacterized protein n=1 Tax=Sorangium cellulosum So0157-2 TaxID=1254432 RepID=S4Y5I9_SORCE|nr:hypothetical protein [Sorangium cellulosum]AGP40682.1 hypothetical protein SCE1572_43060 [Sorangium cellulosum So0157-2]
MSRLGRAGRRRAVPAAGGVRRARGGRAVPPAARRRRAGRRAGAAAEGGPAGAGTPACSEGSGVRPASWTGGPAGPKPGPANAGGAAGGGGCAAFAASIRSVFGAGWKDIWLGGAGSDGGGAETNGRPLAEKTPLVDSTSCCETSPGGRVPPRAETFPAGGWV